MSGPFGSSQWMYSSGGGFYPYEIDQSLRFNDNDSAYLSRSPASNTNRKTWTWSGWIKRGAWETNADPIFTARSGLNFTQLIFGDNENIYLNQWNGSPSWTIGSNRLFRDASAWYHIVASFDSTQATSTNRVKLYVNGEQITSLETTSYPSQNQDSFINSTTTHYIGSYGGGEIFDGYMAEVNFVDGQALDPTSFGEFKSGVWVANEYTGSYGTNGFYLDFSNSGSIGADSSGNGNNWTANSLAATDVVLDSPTNNFATFNPLNARFSSASTQEGNLRWVKNTSSDFAIIYGNFGMSSGKWYMEVDVKSRANYFNISVANSSRGPNTDADNNLSRYRLDVGYLQKRVNSTSSTTQVTGASTSAGIIGIAFDADNGTCAWYHNNSLQGTVTGLNTDETYFLQIYGDGGSNNANVYINHGQDSSFAGTRTAQGNTDANGIGDFYYTPPSGYLALCSANLPIAEGVDPAEDNSPQDYFNTVLYSGDNTSNRSITGMGFQPDFTWLKTRNTGYNHYLFDAVRGAGQVLKSNTTEAESNQSTSFNSFDSDGFTVSQVSGWEMNPSGISYVSWNWRAGNGTSSNTDGSITSTVSVNQDAGFSVLTYTGNGTTGATVGHGLGKAPDFYWVRWRNNTSNYHVYHSSLGATKGLILNETNSEATNSGFWNNTEPTSSVFSLGYYGGSNASGGLFSAVCFTEIEGFSAFGKYIGNGSTNGPFIYTGHRPAFVLMKHINGSNNWLIYDDERLGYNKLNNFLYPNQSQQEDVASDFPRIDILSNGFKLINNYGDINGSGGEYIYATFASNPFKYANAR